MLIRDGPKITPPIICPATVGSLKSIFKILLIKIVATSMTAKKRANFATKEAFRPP